MNFIIIIIVRFFIMYGHYNRKIERNVDNKDEEKALEIVENYNYSEIFNLERYLYGKWANFIDSDVIEHYNKEYEKLKDQWARHNVELIYKAEVYNITNLEINYDYIPVYDEYKLKIYDANKKFVDIRGEVLPEIIATFNGTDYTLYNVEIDFKLNFSNIYLVYLNFYYSDYYGSLAGYFLEIYQIIIMDMNFQPIFIFIDPEQFES